MINCIITSRMSSKRLPNKALLHLQGKPMLQHVYDRLVKCKHITNIIVATSAEGEDDAIDNHCASNNIKVFRGCLTDVSVRIADCLNVYPCQAFVRISGDSPLIDPKLVDDVICAYEHEKHDICTNVLLRTYPKGQSVEVISTKTYLRDHTNFENSFDREHVTTYFYANARKYEINNIRSNTDYSNVQMSVDEETDFRLINKILSKLKRDFDWNDALEEINSQ